MKHKDWRVVGWPSAVCSRCDNPRDVPSKRYCRKCNAAHTREWRKTHPMSDAQKVKHNIRTKTRMRVKRGLLIKYPCEICGDVNVEAHHPDYTKPYDVKWLCFKHHRELHRQDKI